MKVRTILKGSLWAVLGYAAMCVFVVLGVGLWGVETVGVKSAIHALWPGLDNELAWPAAGIVGGFMTLLLILGAEAAKELISEYRLEQRALRWQARKMKQTEWFSQLRDINSDTPTWDLEEIYWDGIELRDELTKGRDSSKLHDDRSHLLAEKRKAEELIKSFDDYKNEKLNEALEVLRNVLEQPSVKS